MKFFYVIFIYTAFISCLQTKKRTTNEKKLYNSLVVLESKLVNKDLTLNKKVANSLYRKSLFFDSIYPKSSHKEDVLVFAAKSADGLNNNIANLKVIDLLIDNFPDSENAPIYLYNKGKIYEEKLKDLPNAILIYKQIVKLYPESKISKNIVDYISFISKSESEQFNHLKNQK